MDWRLGSRAATDGGQVPADLAGHACMHRAALAPHLDSQHDIACEADVLQVAPAVVQRVDAHRLLTLTGTQERFDWQDRGAIVLALCTPCMLSWVSRAQQTSELGSVIPNRMARVPTLSLFTSLNW